MTTQVTQKSPFSVLKELTEGESFKKRIESCLGKNSGAFTSSVLDLVSQDGKLQQCDPREILQECIKVASLKLSFSKSLGYAYLVPYNNTVKDQYGKFVIGPDGKKVKKMKPTMVIGYLGYIQLALRSGLYKYIHTDVIREGELTGFKKLTGEICLDGKRTSNKIVGYFAYIQQTNGYEHTFYCTVEDMAEYAKQYAPSIPQSVSVEMLIEKANAPIGDGVGWLPNFTSMALKTCIRKVLKYGSMSVEMQSVFDSDSEVGSANEEFSDYEEVSLDDDAPKAIEATAQQAVNVAMAEETPVVATGTQEQVANTAAIKAPF